jgi:hypothetical protein
LGTHWDVAVRREAAAHFQKGPGRGLNETSDITDAVAFARDKLGFQPDAQQELVLRGGRRGIVNCTRQWGKSTVTAAKAVHRAYSAPGSLTLVVTPGARQSGEFLRKAKDFAGRLGMTVRGDGHNELSIAFPNGSRIVGLPENETTIRGFSAVSLLLIDEASRVRDTIYRAMRPTLMIHDGDLWLMSTPNGKRGFFWEEWERGGEEWERISVPATGCPRISERFLAEEKANATEDWYRQEYLCEFVDQEGAVFTREMIEGMYQDYEGL